MPPEQSWASPWLPRRRQLMVLLLLAFAGFLLTQLSDPAQARAEKPVHGWLSSSTVDWDGARTRTPDDRASRESRPAAHGTLAAAAADQVPAVVGQDIDVGE